LALLHFAYGFNPIQLVSRYSPMTGYHRREIESHLAGCAAESMRATGPLVQEALRALRCDTGWQGRDPDEADVLAKQFVLCLLRDFTPAQSLGRQGEFPYHLVLSSLLPDAGWSSSELATLLRGEPLSKGLEQTGLAWLTPLLSGLDDLGGWLGHVRAQALLQRLEAVTKYFEEEPARQQQLLSKITAEWTANAHDLAMQAYIRAAGMLRFATNPSQALFLILD
jgi:hypothetical protein